MSTRWRAGALATVITMVAACGGASRGNGASNDAPGLVAPLATTVSPAASTGLPATSVAPTVPANVAVATSATATTSAPTTAAPTTVATTAAPIVLPVPAPAPSDKAIEPKVVLGRVEIPKIHLDVSLFEGVSLSTLDRGPGHWPGSALPGDIGNVVVAGHRVSHSRPFRNIDQLVDGDQVIFTIGDATYTYVVTGTEIVTPDKIDIIDQTPARTATLFACHPPGSTQYRWVTHLALQS